MNLDLNRRILERQEELSHILVNMSKVLKSDKNASKNIDLKILNNQYRSKIREIDQLVKERDRAKKKGF